MNTAMKNIISLSGGKDSTAMLLMMLERNEHIHSAVFFDTGWEFAEMLDHIDKLEKYTGVPFMRLKPLESFDYLMSEKPIRKRLKTGGYGDVHRMGNGWPSMQRRWCTRIKINAINKYYGTQGGLVSCIGFAADEARRVPVVAQGKWETRYPLIEYDISEKEALRYCYDQGFNWGGLYEIFGRVSCFCCPLQRIGELRDLRTHRPELWERMLTMDKDQKRGFRGLKTVNDLEKTFLCEDLQMDLF